MANENDIKYAATPTASRFHVSNDFVRGLMGPVGSGKSVACVMEVLKRGMEVPANKRGVRQSRWAIIRNTYPELQTTTIKTWKEWIPPNICRIWEGSKPIRAMVKMPLPDNTRVEQEVYFIPLDKPDDVKKLLSLELTGSWLNEAREIPQAILDGVTSRVGRYPATKNFVNPDEYVWTGVIMDTNPPDDDHWWYKMAEEERPKGYMFLRQPGALVEKFDENGKAYYEPNPIAENINNLPLGYEYYHRMIPGKKREWIKAYVLGQYSTILAGKPVYPEYNDEVHCVDLPREEFVYRGLPLRLGWDFGLTPAVAFIQQTSTGAINIIDELVSEDMGITQFVNDVVRPHLMNEYHGMAVISHGDPAGTQRAQTDERTCVDILLENGIPTTPTTTNKFTARREAVATPMMRMADGKPGFQLNGRFCKQIRRGFLGGYQYAKVNSSSTEKYKERPDKNKYSHIHDALQYALLGLADGIIEYEEPRAQVRQVVNTNFLY